MGRIISIIIALLSVIGINAQPKQEIRAAWITLEDGFDWPCGIKDYDKQKDELCSILDRLATVNINTIYIQMQVDGAVAWQSSYMPAMSIITGDGALSLPYDVANYVIEECRERHIECHAWLTPFRIGESSHKYHYAENKVKHPMSLYPELCISYLGINYLDPGIPDARELIYNIYKELVSDYDFDGVNLDLTCYQGLDFGDTESFFEYNHDYLNIEEWRRRNLETFISELSNELRLIKPELKIGISPIGVYKPIIGYENQTAYNYTYQDPCEWLNNGWVDYISPKMFHTEKEGFSKNLSKWVNESHSGHTIIGITPNSFSSDILSAQIEIARDAKANGIALYSAKGVLNSSDFYEKLQSDYFHYPAHIVPQNGLLEKPEAPLNVTQEFVGNGYRIAWEAPETTDVRYYSIYLTDGNSINLSDLDCVIAAKVGETNFFYPSEIDNGINFAVTTFDRNYNESSPAYAKEASIEDVVINEKFIYHQGILYVSGSRTINRIQIYSFTGTDVMIEYVNDCEASIDCSSLGMGVFVARVIYESGATKVKKIVR